MEENLLHSTEEYVKSILQGAEAGHDWFHIERVRKLATYIREKEGAGDRLTIELASLLHDISDPKFNGGDEEKGGQMARAFLLSKGLDRERSSHIGRIIRHVSYKGGIGTESINSLEFQIVQDADRLDALGAIGIARTFHYGGHKNRPIYDPSVSVAEYKDSASYYQSKAPTINHFYEKLLKLKELMNTGTGKVLARERHDFMLRFLEQFYKEWDP